MGGCIFGGVTESSPWGGMSLAGQGLGSLRPHGSQLFGAFVIFGISAEFAVSSCEWTSRSLLQRLSRLRAVVSPRADLTLAGRSRQCSWETHKQAQPRVSQETDPDEVPILCQVLMFGIVQLQFLYEDKNDKNAN